MFKLKSSADFQAYRNRVKLQDEKKKASATAINLAWVIDGVCRHCGAEMDRTRFKR